MTPELSAPERIRILRDRIHHLNLNLAMDMWERLDAIQAARKALLKAEKDIIRGLR